MEKELKEKKSKAIDAFLGVEAEEKKEAVQTVKKTNKSGEIIEHVEKKLVLEDGRQLLL